MKARTPRRLREPDSGRDGRLITVKGLEAYMGPFGRKALPVLLSTLAMAQSQPEVRQAKVQIPAGQYSVTLKGTIKGYQSVEYLLNAQAGTNWLVSLKAGGSTYFNIMAPGADTALFIGSTSGDKFEGGLPKSGEYKILVYQMRNAARRGTASSYAITFRNQPGHVATAGEAGPAKYNAKGMTKCSAGGAGLGEQCEFRVVRKAGGAAEIWLDNPAARGNYRVLNFAKGQFTANDGAKVSAKKGADTWLVSVNGNEHYEIFEAIIFGG